MESIETFALTKPPVSACTISFLYLYVIGLYMREKSLGLLDRVIVNISSRRNYGDTFVKFISSMLVSFSSWSCEGQRM